MRTFVTWGTERQEVLGSMVVGRPGQDAQIVVSRLTISRRHCMLTAGEDGSVTLQDLGSMNGTWVGDEKITAPTSITNGGTFEIGRVAPVPVKNPAGERGVIITVEIAPDEVEDDPGKTSAGLGGRPTTVDRP